MTQTLEELFLQLQMFTPGPEVRKSMIETLEALESEGELSILIEGALQALSLEDDQEASNLLEAAVNLPEYRVETNRGILVVCAQSPEEAGLLVEAMGLIFKRFVCWE
jgi:hypothetical protein